MNYEFGEYLNEPLRDWLVCGLRNTGIKKRLISEANLTLAKIAQGMEAAEKNAKRLQRGEAVHVPVNKVIPRREKKTSRPRLEKTGEVDMCLVLADFRTLPATSARKKDTLLRRAGADQQHIDEERGKASTDDRPRNCVRP